MICILKWEWAGEYAYWWQCGEHGRQKARMSVQHVVFRAGDHLYLGLNLICFPVSTQEGWGHVKGLGMGL